MSNHDEGRVWKRRREDAGFEQDEVADLLGIHRVTLSRYESGARALPPLVKEALGALYSIREHAKSPAPPPLSDYWRGVLYAAEAMAETTHRLLKEARQAAPPLDNRAEVEAGAVSRSKTPGTKRAAQ
jgi:transcriptional regulator with XRE-family HTH domain